MSNTSVTATVIAAALTLAPVAHAMPMGGSYTGRVDTQTPQVLGPNEVKVQQTASGLNNGPGTPLDGAKVQWVETVTLKNGQGPVQGTITFSTPVGSTSSAYKGMVATDAQGRVTAKGTYKDTASTGEFEGIRGKGSFTVTYTSKTDFTGEWKGDVTLPKQKTSNR
ncbi:hypothetical protein [Methylobacterium brachythecii]|uniref:Uncharacterized protein n=1 Tax=Methylobacterium brachythecii TaxID=1176177 RepID=A0A7W6AN92_9HYPH|nr:hypothetical protein [Methylobacterium brachythecii]MBB3904364.1 hypothetical protein [Methylobacterium brachythecii]GLS46510.1 hypothetical protein GCM10007884_45040 [Methylobacterium brachythecii]